MTATADARRLSLLYTSPRVFRLQAEWTPTKPHEPAWRIVHFPVEAEDDFRAVFGTLHVAATDGQITATVGALMTETGTVDRETYDTNFEALLMESESIETLYTHARQQVLTLAALADVDVEVSDVPPQATVEQGQSEPDDPSGPEQDHAHA